MRSRTLLVTTILTALLAACGGGDDDGDVAGQPESTDAPIETPADAPQEPETEADAAEGEAAGPTVAVASSGMGDILVDGDGMTLYVFLPDDRGTPTCTDSCADTWPLFEGPASAGDGVDEALLGTAEHPSGTTMATYGGWPLYSFASDQAPGDVNGQGIGDSWYVIGPDGEPIQDETTGGIDY